MQPLFTLVSRAFWMPKRGSTEEEYEDSLAFNVAQGRFAVADGASESSFARGWAKLLVEGYVASPPAITATGLLDWLQPLRQDWRESVPWTSLPYYAEEKAKAGAFCTFLGLRFSPTPVNGTLGWRAVAIGDCCLFQLRGGVLMKAFPVTRSEEFGNTPQLLCSVVAKTTDLTDLVVKTASGAQPGDVFILATDALAQWCLRSVESGQPCWPVLIGCNNQEAFRAWVDDLRSNHQIRNDDVSMLLVEVSNGMATTI
jgi:hypothetical protein